MRKTSSYLRLPTLFIVVLEPPDDGDLCVKGRLPLVFAKHTHSATIVKKRKKSVPWYPAGIVCSLVVRFDRWAS